MLPRFAARPRLVQRLLAILTVVLLGTGLIATTSAQELDDNPLRPVDTSSPRATYESFREDVERAYRSWRLRENVSQTRALAERALRTMDLGGIGDALRQEVGVGDALFLYDTISRVGPPDPASIPDAEKVAAQGLTRWTMPGTEITIARAADGPRVGEFLFSADTVRRARLFYELVQDRPPAAGTPDMIATWRAAPGLLMPDALARRIWQLPHAAFMPVVGQPAWKWLATLLCTLLAVLLVWNLWRWGRRWDKRCRRQESGWQVGRPLAILAALVILGILDVLTGAAIQLRDRPGVAISVILTVVHYILLAWLLAEAIAGIGRFVVASLAANSKSLDAALLRLCFRILSIVGALTVVLHAASELGLSITPIIAGLGVGGLAVALAIRPTLENLVGGFVLFADKPVRVGEFCGFGDKMGTVEEIGLRSTRLRGLDRTVITVPNADFAQMQIVNFTRRDMNLFQCKIGLRYETTPDQLRFVAAKVRKLLIRHSKVSPDPARVRFSEFGDSAYVLDVFAFVRAADWNEFMAIKEDLNLRISEIVRDSGTSFAFPSQTVYFTRDGGIDAARGETVETEVRHWREEKRLPFPDYDFAERAEMEDTLPFPPEGSPDYRPRPPPAPPPGQDAAKPKRGWFLGRRRRQERVAP
jgi:MscS family membrane protein